MGLTVDVFWSFRSPYSYLATPRLAAGHGPTRPCRTSRPGRSPQAALDSHPEIAVGFFRRGGAGDR